MQTKIEASTSGTVNNIVNKQPTDFIANSMVDRIHSEELTNTLFSNLLIKRFLKSYLKIYTDNLISIEPTFH